MSLFVRGRWICLAVLLAIAATALAGESDQADSGWSIAKPAVDVHAPPNNPQMRILLDHVLRSTEGGLQLQAAPAPQSDTAIRTAERAGAVNGWRTIGNPPVVSDTKTQNPSSVGHGPAPRGDKRPKSAAPTSRGVTLEFRTALSTRNESNDATIGETGASVSRTEPLPDEEHAPEQVAGETALNRGRPIEDDPIVPIETEVEDRDTRFTEEPVESVHDAEPSTESPLVSDVRPTPSPKSPPAPLQPLTRQLTSLRTRLRSVLRGYYQKSLNSQDHDPWEVMHGMLAYGIHSRIHQGGPRGEQITAVGWLCYNRPCKGKSLLYVTPEGELRAKQGVGLQGHMGQLLAMLAQCHVAPEYPIRVGNQQFTVRDLIEAEKKTCYENSELTFKLIAMSHYLDLDATWVNDQGIDWNFPKLISEELAQPIRGAACGGTHRLSGLSLAVKARAKSGQPIDGEYARAAEFVKNYQNYAFRLQNRDGSLSTKWFQGPGDENDDDRRVKTTGHILEWLVYSLSDEELRDQRTIRAVTYLTNLMYSDYDHEWEVGPISHATHALLLYDERVFQPFDAAGQNSITGTRASRGSASRNSSRR